MTDLGKRLPSIRAMQVLEALERVGSLGQVADEMALTRSAISHILRRLEADLGYQLTRPDGRSVRLTQKGRQFAIEARRALAIIADAAGASEPMPAGDLRLVCPAGFATLWLAERLGRFSASYPDIQLSITTGRTLDDLGDEAADVQIAFGDDAALQDRAELLARIALFPVCAPALLGSGAGLRRAGDIARLALLHLVTQVDWERWLVAAGATAVDPRRGIVFSDMPMVQAAAVSGQGIALGDSLTARSALESGQLVRPFELSIPSRWSYFVRFDPHGPATDAAIALISWIRSELGGDPHA